MLSCDAIAEYINHPSVLKIKDMYKISDDSFHFTSVDVCTIDKKLCNVDNKKSQGYDNIPGKLLRLAHSALAPHLTYLVNEWTSAFPYNMKNAELSPVYKRHDNLDKVNYRPVSVLTAVSKLNESVMNDQLGQYFINIFHEFLCAFGKKYSCQSTLVKMIEDWKESLDKNNVIDALFMDLSKAFDNLPHGLLIAKFRAYGLSLSACDLLLSYLSNRHQQVKIKGSRSEWREVKKGVPQSSILGPLLFNIFVNDMFHLETDCNNTMEWFSVNGLQANPSKFQFMLLSSSNIDKCNTSLYIDDRILKPEPHVKILGVFLNDKLSFYQHVNIICAKAARQLNALARISMYLNISSRSLLYNSFVRSNFIFCAMVRHFYGKTNNNKIEKIQERALRIIDRDYESSYEDLVSAAVAPTMLTRRLRVVLLEVFKSMNMLNSDYLNDMFVKIKDGNYSFRNTRKLLQPKKKTITFGLRSIAYLGAKLWNDNVCNFSDAREIDFSTLKMTLLCCW